MAKTSEMTYVKEAELGKVGEVRFEVGHYVADGKSYEHKIYGFQQFTKSEKVVCKISLEHFFALQQCDFSEFEVEEEFD